MWRDTLKNASKALKIKYIGGGVTECIFVDDCGQDGSIAVLEEMMANYGGNIQFHLVHHEHNKGQSAARNTGIRHATGEYIYFLDSDDSLTPDCIEKLMAMTQKYPTVDLVQGDNTTNTPEYHPNVALLPEYSDDRKWIKTAFLTYMIHLVPWNKLIKRDFILQNNLFFVEGMIHEDTVWMYFLGKHVRRIAFCHDKTYNYRDNQASTMHRSTDKHDEAYKSVISILSKHVEAPLATKEILYIISWNNNFPQEFMEKECIAHIPYNKLLLRQFIHLKDCVNKTNRRSLIGLFYRVGFAFLARFIDLTYPKHPNQG